MPVFAVNIPAAYNSTHPTLSLVFDKFFVTNLNSYIILIFFLRLEVKNALKNVGKQVFETKTTKFSKPFKEPLPPSGAKRKSSALDEIMKVSGCLFFIPFLTLEHT